MTVPVTGITPAYGFEYLVEGEPARNTRAKLERTVKRLEAALLATGTPPPGAVDHAALAARVGALEPGPWITPSSQARTNFGLGDWTPLRYRKETATSVRIQGMLNSGGAANPLMTLPVGFRPAKHTMLRGMSDTVTVACQLLATDGILSCPATASWLWINDTFTLG